MATTSDETISTSPPVTSNHIPTSQPISRTNGATVISIPTASGLFTYILNYLPDFDFLADAIASFIWGSYLKTTGAHGAPVSFFRHVNL